MKYLKKRIGWANRYNFGHNNLHWSSRSCLLFQYGDEMSKQEIWELTVLIKIPCTLFAFDLANKATSAIVTTRVYSTTDCLLFSWAKKKAKRESCEKSCNILRSKCALMWRQGFLDHSIPIPTFHMEPSLFKPLIVKYHPCSYMASAHQIWKWQISIYTGYKSKIILQGRIPEVHTAYIVVCSLTKWLSKLYRFLRIRSEPSTNRKCT